MNVAATAARLGRTRSRRGAVATIARTLTLLVAAFALGACMSSPSRPPEVTAAGGLVYPQSARLKKVEGYVRVQYDVTVDGTVANPRVIESVPAGTFDAAALDAVRTWKFHPAVHDGKAVETKGLVSRLDFKLGESEDYAR